MNTNKYCVCFAKGTNIPSKWNVKRKGRNVDRILEI